MQVLRTSVVAFVVSIAVLAGAFPAAADGSRGPQLARPYQPSIWQGLYAGLHLGHGESGSADGFVGGAQVGYNWQTGLVVYGLEADVSFTGIEETVMGVTASIDWLATARGRVGYLLTPRILAYGTAGFGMAKASASHGLGSETESDFVYGLGVEGKINQSLSLRLEYLAFSDLDIDVVRAGLNFKFGN